MYSSTFFVGKELKIRVLVKAESEHILDIVRSKSHRSINLRVREYLVAMIELLSIKSLEMKICNKFSITLDRLIVSYESRVVNFYLIRCLLRKGHRSVRIPARHDLLGEVVNRPIRSRRLENLLGLHHLEGEGGCS